MEPPLNIEALLNPISSENPAGEDLHYSEVYDLIKEARRADDVLEQGEWQIDIKTSDWRQVVKLARPALIERSKDLQIAVWLTEAWVYLHGFAGLSAGLELIRRLMEDFWSLLYPAIEDGDFDYRIGPLMVLNEKLPSAVYQVSLCGSDSSRGYNYYQYQESRLVGFGQNLDKEQKKRREAMIQEGKITGEDFDAAVQATPIVYYKQLCGQLLNCREALRMLDDVVTEKFSPDPPGFTQLIEAVEACDHIAGRILNEKSKSEFVPEESVESDPVEQNPDFCSLPEPNEHDHPGFDSQENPAADLNNVPTTHAHEIGDIRVIERTLWQQVSQKMGNGRLKDAMDQLLSAAALSPSIREKNRYLLLLAKLCLKADRADLASPIAEELHSQVEALQLEKWEHPSWIAEVVETLYRCLAAADEAQSDRARELFQKLCLLNVTKAAGYRLR